MCVCGFIYSFPPPRAHVHPSPTYVVRYHRPDGTSLIALLETGVALFRPSASSVTPAAQHHTSGLATGAEEEEKEEEKEKDREEDEEGGGRKGEGGGRRRGRGAPSPSGIIQ